MKTVQQRQAERQRRYQHYLTKDPSGPGRKRIDVLVRPEIADGFDRYCIRHALRKREALELIIDTALRLAGVEVPPPTSAGD